MYGSQQHNMDSYNLISGGGGLDRSSDRFLCIYHEMRNSSPDFRILIANPSITRTVLSSKPQATRVLEGNNDERK